VDCGAPRGPGPHWLDLDEVYDPLIARFVEACIDRNPPPTRDIDILNGGDVVRWTDALGQMHTLDVLGAILALDSQEDDI
jgi:hypothetical protein